jgi:hypothetical protein
MRRILFISSTHGNEDFSINILKEIEASYDQLEYGYSWIIGNEKAQVAGTRFIDKDLNRSAPGNLLSPHYEVRRAAKIMEICKGFDIVIDIHGTDSNCGIVKLIPYPTRKNIELAESIPLTRNVIWYSEKSSSSGPISQHTPCASIEIECGPMNSPTVKATLRECIVAILKANLSGRDYYLAGQEYFTVYGPQTFRPAGISFSDFEEVTTNNEAFFPFLSSNPYGNTQCYKMKKIRKDDLLPIIPSK